MQKQILEPGAKEVTYQCNICPNGCTVIEIQTKGIIVSAPAHCHRFPSQTPHWIKV